MVQSANERRNEAFDARAKVTKEMAAKYKKLHKGPDVMHSLFAIVNDFGLPTAEGQQQPTTAPQEVPVPDDEKPDDQMKDQDGKERDGVETDATAAARANALAAAAAAARAEATEVIRAEQIADEEMESLEDIARDAQIQQERIERRKRAAEMRNEVARVTQESVNEAKKAKKLADDAATMAEATVQAASTGGAEVTLLDPPPTEPIIPTAGCTGGKDGKGKGKVK